MRNLAIFVALLSAAVLPALVGAEEVWSLGADDQNYAEFALSGDHASFAARFPQDPVIDMASPDAAANWPWIHPGNRDSWAGSRAHTFTITFDLPAGCDAPVFELVLDTVAAHYGSPPVLKIDLNGTVREVHTRATCRSDRVLEDPAEGQPAVYREVFLAAELKPKGNRLAITNAEGSWLLYDCLSFHTRTAEFEQIEVAVERGVLRGEGGGLCRQLTVAYAGGVLIEEADLSAAVGSQQVGRKLDPKTCAMEAKILVPIPQADAAAEATVSLAYRGKTLTKTVAIPPERPWEVHLVHQTHLDIGYTHTQEDVLARQVQSLKDSLQYIDETKDYPEESQFKFHPEGMWAVDEFMRTTSEEEKEALVRAARTRDIHMDAMYAQAMTGMYNDEELFELMAGAARFGKTHGVTIDSAMQTDVPGYTWGLVPALAQNGVRYMTMGPNNGHRVGRVYEWADKPFWWESPSGKERVLCWVSGFGYALWHGRPQGDRLEEARLFQILDQLAAKEFPYNLVMLRYNIEGDNGRPNRALSDSVKEWNEKYAWPKVVISRNSDVMRELERRHGKDLPVVRGDYTPYWEDGCASTSEATSLCRIGCERIVQAQALFAMLRPGAFPAGAFDAAWTDLVMYDEHTWGAHCSISQPEHQLTRDQWRIKAAFALDANSQSRRLLKAALPEAPDAAVGLAAVDVYNTTSWPRTDLVALPRDVTTLGEAVKDSEGRPVRVQRLSTGELALLAVDVPPLGSKRFFFEPGTAQSVGAAKAAGNTLSNGKIRLTVGSHNGAIVQLASEGSRADLAAAGDHPGLNEYVYVAGRDPANQKRNGPVTITVKESGPLVASLVAECDAPGCRKLVRQYRVVDGLDRVEIVNVVDKAPVREKEGVHFGFGFNVPQGVMRVDIPWGVIRPEQDQLPGACKNYLSVGRWVDVSNDQCGVTWATLDAPLVEVGSIAMDVVRPFEAKYFHKHLEPSQTFYSYVMNNYWETNYKADQEGRITFRYALWPHGPYDAAAAGRFGIERSRPLVTVPVKPDAPQVQSLVRVEPSSVIVSLLKPTEDGQALLVRLFNMTDKPQRASLSWPRSAPKRLTLSDPFEQSGAEVTGPLDMPGWGIATLRVELN